MSEEKNNRERILLVEDNERILYGNQLMLQWAGYDVDVAVSLAEARTLMEKLRPDCVVLDIMLPDGNGLEFMKQLRNSGWASVPILLLTGLTTQDDILLGLKSGGDDYLTKPYDFDILLARVEALLRRFQRVPEKVALGRFTLDVASNVAMLDGVDLLLTQKEFALLLIFTQNPERFLDGEYLYEKLWNQPAIGNGQAVRKVIHHLRAKLIGSGWRIQWSRGEGYCLEKE